MPNTLLQSFITQITVKLLLEESQTNTSSALFQALQGLLLALT